MLYHRQGLPEENEIVLCKVSKIFPNSVFVDILEYGNSGLIHISEIAPGRIRNLREYVTPDRQIVCKVLRVDREKGHIDLSLRRVNSHERSEKLEEIKQELKAEQLVKNLATKLKRPLPQVYQEITKGIFKEYLYLHLCFKDVTEGKKDLTTLGIEKNLAQEITAAVIDKFKPAKITLKGEMQLHSYQADGMEKIRNTLITIERLSPTIKISYLGAGRYHLIIEDFDYKPAENTFAKVREILEKFTDKLSTATLEREKNE
ncbi:S1 RNA-binding domain-containing protein [Candidatus Woesearchaeota archaeon]|nr:S1 RNA-binding domain-containing protein [Candidatus Woesearchaeota archaeon]